MLTTKRRRASVLAALLFCASAAGQTICEEPRKTVTFNSTLALTKSFVEEYRNKALIETNLIIDKYQSPHGIKDSGEDGDIHIAGRDDEVKLPLVAEIMNPRYFKTLEGDLFRDFMKELRELQAEQPVKPVEVEGVWRLWFEHPGKVQVMGDPVPVATGSSPPHVFEIHPVTKFKTFDTRPSFIEIKDYQKKATEELKIYDAHKGSKTIPYYECLLASIMAEDLTDGRAGIMIASKKAQYNYTDLIIELAGRPKKYDDCVMVLAHVYESFERETRLTNEPRRMIFVDGSPPAKLLSDKKYSKGDVLRILGIPRINLDRVFAVAQKSKGKPKIDVLPYEIIVAAVFESEE